MSDQLLTEAQKKDVRDVAELQIRRYFDDHYKNALPQLIALSIQLHNDSPNAHGKVERRFSRMMWIMTGVAIAGGAVGANVSKLLGSVLG